MVKEFYHFIKVYLKVAAIKGSTLFLMFFTSLLNKGLQLLIPLFAAWIIDYATGGDIHMTITSLIFLVSAYACERFTIIWNVKIYALNMHHMVTTLETRVLNKITSVDENFSNEISKGNLFNTVFGLYDVGDSLDSIVNIITSTIQIIVMAFIVSFYNVYIAILFLVYALLFIAVRNWADRKSSHYLAKEMKWNDKYTSLFSQMVSGMQEIKTFDMFDKLMVKLKYAQKKYGENFEKQRHYITIRGNDTKLITYGFRILIYVIALYLMMEKQAGIELLVVVIGYHQSLEIYINRFITSTSSLRESMVAVERLKKVLEYKNPISINYGNCDKDEIKGEVEFKNVSFAYLDRKILNNVSFKIKPHSLTAIVGQSGTGKTSILNLLLRLYKVDSGEILIDGTNIYDYTKQIHSSNVSVVTQKPFIFNMSIRQNLNFVDTSIVNQIEACKRVGIHDFIMTLPRGYNTILRENANNISGGQKQLIALARTILSKSEVLLFDEITSALDPETGKQIMNLTKDLKKDHTIIMITHKPEMMKKADRIIVLHNGKIVGDGKHNELMINNEHYRWLQARKSASKFGVFDDEI